ncbi:MAG: GumC family protein [bacterium]
MAKNKENESFPVEGGGGGLPSTEYREGIPDTEEEIHLRDYIDVVMRRKWLVVGILFLAFVSTLIFSLAADKLYQASGTLEVSPGGERVTKFEEVVEQRIRTEEFLNTQVSLLKSDALAQRVINAMDLKEHPVIRGDEDEGPGLVQQAKDYLKSLVREIMPKEEEEEEEELAGGLLAPEEMEQRKLIGFIKNNLEVSPSRESMIINVSFISQDRQLSQSVVNELMGQFVDWQMDQKVESSSKAREYLMKQIDRAKINLEKAEEQQHEFARQAGIVSLDSKLNSTYRQLEETNEALAEAESELVRRETKYMQAVEAGPENLPEVLNSGLIEDLKTSRAELRSEYENMVETFHEQYPDVRKIKSRMNSIEERIEEETDRIFNSIEHEYLAAKARVETLEQRMERNQERAMELNEGATQYQIMAREVETNKAIYQSLLERAKEVESMAGVSPSNTRLVDRASMPIFPAKPDVRRNLLLAIVLGLMLGVGMAFLMEYFADTITNPDQITDRFQIPILGVIPLEREGSDYPLERIFANDPRAAMSEALRTSRVSIQLSGSDSTAKCAAVTSTLPGEGKTTIASNMAQAFAGAGERVLLIDADLRKPRLHKIFTAEPANNGHGLSSYLAGVTDGNIISATDVENLYYIPSGPIPPNPVELLASERFARLMEKCGAEFDRIVIDSPPHHGFADLLVLSRQVGGIILVCAMGEATRDGLRHFKRAMSNVQGTVLGCIVNKINLHQRYGYRSYYKYYRAYNYEYGKKGRKKLGKSVG